MDILLGGGIDRREIPHFVRIDGEFLWADRLKHVRLRRNAE
jgi:hypothetical protein